MLEDAISIHCKSAGKRPGSQIGAMDDRNGFLYLIMFRFKQWGDRYLSKNNTTEQASEVEAVSQLSVLNIGAWHCTAYDLFHWWTSHDSLRCRLMQLRLGKTTEFKNVSSGLPFQIIEYFTLRLTSKVKSSRRANFIHVTTSYTSSGSFPLALLSSKGVCADLEWSLRELPISSPRNDVLASPPDTSWNPSIIISISVIVALRRLHNPLVSDFSHVTTHLFVSPPLVKIVIEEQGELCTKSRQKSLIRVSPLIRPRYRKSDI